MRAEPSGPPDHGFAESPFGNVVGRLQAGCGGEVPQPRPCRKMSAHGLRTFLLLQQMPSSNSIRIRALRGSSSRRSRPRRPLRILDDSPVRRSPNALAACAIPKLGMIACCKPLDFEAWHATLTVRDQAPDSAKVNTVLVRCASSWLVNEGSPSGLSIASRRARALQLFHRLAARETRHSGTLV
jgi:hypothetical protein